MPTPELSYHQESNVEESDDFKYFKEFVMNQKVERLLPLEEQLLKK